MKKLFSTAAIFFSVVIGIQAQNRVGAQGNVRIMKDKPGVYVDFERVGQLKLPDPGDEKDRVWLRLHNNTRWPLMLDMSAVPSAAYGDAELFYDVLTDGEMISRGRCHVCTHNALGPGKSLVFSIPRGDLTEGRAIRVSFSYGWEDWNDVSGGREAVHYVYFYASQLPKSSQQSKK